MDKFSEEILSGLHSDPKTLPSKYLYDARGDELFQEIMKMPEYYLTDCEFEIFNTQKETIKNYFYEKSIPFQLLEFGAGDGYKTKVLLKYLFEEKVDFEYIPIDISQNVLDLLKANIEPELPDLKVNYLCQEYFEALNTLKENKTPKIILFLGANIGNFSKETAVDFLNKMSTDLNKGDMLMIGADLHKNPHSILDAYNDKQGITRAFNHNLLRRINKNMGANFREQNFMHYPTYNPITGECRSYLVANTAHTVYFSNTGDEIKFDYWEPIHVETSKKYRLKELEDIAQQTGFEVIKHFQDCKAMFTDTFWRKL